MLAVVLERLLAAEDRAHDLEVLARARERLAPGLAVPALGDLGPARAETEEHALPERRSSVATVAAVVAGVRAGICMIAVPSLISFVRPPTHASGETASEP